MRRSHALRAAVAALGVVAVGTFAASACSLDWTLPAHICEPEREAACAAEPVNKLCDGLRGCVQCRTDGDCLHGPKPYCHPDSGRCVNCTKHSHCEAISPNGDACDPVRNICVQCTEDQHCTRYPGRGACNPGTFACVACTDDSDCVRQGLGTQCDAAIFECEIECSVDAHCSTSEYGSKCFDGLCGCDESGGCESSRAGSKCFLDAPGLCGCGSAADCVGPAAAGPVCSAEVCSPN